MQSYGLYDTNECIVPLQRALNEKLKLELNPDGNIGKITQAAILSYQVQNGIEDSDENGACYGQITQNSLSSFIKSKYIQEQDFIDAANKLSVEVACIKSVTAVEAKQFGFLCSGYPTILFERHKFYQYVSQLACADRAVKYSATNPDICNLKAGGYLGGKAEVDRFNSAFRLSSRAAMLSTSWGLFQIMGFNFPSAGYMDVDTFVAEMRRSERSQLMAFVTYIKNNNILHNSLKNKDWSTFARLYNGAAYAKNNYDSKLQSNYLKYS